MMTNIKKFHQIGKEMIHSKLISLIQEDKLNIRRKYLK